MSRLLHMLSSHFQEDSHIGHMDFPLFIIMINNDLKVQ